MIVQTYSDFNECIKNLTSRAITIAGFGCVEVYVPIKDKTFVEEYLQDTLPENVQLTVQTLKEFKVSLKKGVFEFGLLSMYERDHFFSIIDKYDLRGETK